MVASLSQNDEGFGGFLWTACRMGWYEQVCTMLQRRCVADIDERGGPFHTSALGTACEYGHHEIVEMLLAHGADTSCMNDRGEAPIHLAITGGNIKVLETLLSSGVDVNARLGISDDTGTTQVTQAFSVSLGGLVI